MKGHEARRPGARKEYGEYTGPGMKGHGARRRRGARNMAWNEGT